MRDKGVLIILALTVLSLVAGAAVLTKSYYDKRSTPKVAAPIVTKAPKTVIPKPTPRPVPPVPKQKPKPEHKPVSPVPEPEKYLLYKVKKGETLSGIAIQYGMKKEIIAEDNKLKDPDKIYKDQKLKIRKSAITKKVEKPGKAKKLEKKKKSEKTEVKKGRRKAKKPAKAKVKEEWEPSRGGFSLWRYPGKNAYKGNIKRAREMENVHEALVAMLGNTKYRELIPVFEEKIRKGEFFLKDIQKGEVFDLMVSTKKGKTVVGRRIKEAWDPKWVRKNKVPRKAERYSVEFEGEEVILTFAYACGNWAITFRPLPPPPPVVKPKKSWLEITKEIFSSDDGKRLRDTEGNLLPVPAFTFIITDLSNGGRIEVTIDSSGYKKIELDPGTYKVEETDHPQWVKFAVLPPDGTVTLRAGETKSVNFKNQQVPPSPIIPPAVPPVTQLPPEQPPEIAPPPPVAPPAPPVTEAPPPPKRRVKKVAECVSQEHEPIGGIFWGTNDVAKSQYVYGEYMAWLRSRTGKCDGTFWGIGAFGSYGSGDVKLHSSFEWREYSIGPQFGGKQYKVGTDENGRYEYTQRQLKLRIPVYRKFRGENDRSGFRATQRTIRAGAYGEAEYGNLKDSYGIFGEGWLDLRRKMKSNFAGVTADKQDSVVAGLYWRHNFTKNWSGKLVGAMGYERWHRLPMFQFNAEVGWKKILFCGPGVKFYPFRSDVLREAGIKLSQIQTITGTCRLEGKPIIEGWFYERNKKSIKVIQPGSPEDFTLPEEEIETAPEETPKEESIQSEEEEHQELYKSGIRVEHEGSEIHVQPEIQTEEGNLVPVAEAGTLHTENTQDSGDKDIDHIDPKSFD